MKENYAETMKAAFREEAHELLAELETALLELETNSTDQELIGRVFRALHTIKGSGAMFGFEKISEFTHEVETVFDQVREGTLPVSKELIDITLLARDQIFAMLDSPEEDATTTGLKNIEIITLLKKLTSVDSTETTPEVPQAEAEKADQPSQEVEKNYRIRFRPAPDIFLHGTNPILLLDEVRQLGECHILSHTSSIPELKSLDPEKCYTGWDILLTTNKGINSIKDVFIFVEDDSELNIEAIEDEEKPGTDNEPKKLGEILVERGDLAPEKLDQILEEKKPIGKILVDAGLVTTEKVESALVEQRHIKETQEKRQSAEQTTSIRVASDKLDSLVNLVGEMVTVQARLTQTTSKVENAVLLAISEEVERLTAELRETAMSMRMLPIGTTFNKFRRLIRDLSGKLGKEVTLTTEGAGTELDKTVIERLNDPMIHLIRNCMDHGIEMPAERKKLGKDPTGTIHLRAAHSGAYVLIEIIDDGGGLNREKILAKAVEKGLVSREAELSDKEIYNLLFMPGFSTAEKVTGLSGRGVGMDVVKRTIDALSGNIEINTIKDKGTTITLKIPLTLAIIEGLLVQLGGDFFVIPLSSIEECVELSREDAASSHGRHLAKVRGSLLPYIPLRQMFNIGGEVPEIQQIVVVSADGRKVGFLVDEVIGQLQTVIKSLGKAYRNIEGISGATILGDGTVALILDVLKLAKKAEIEEKASVQQ